MMKSAMDVTIRELTKLTGRERDVLIFRFRLCPMPDGQRPTLANIAKHFLVTPERARQIEAKALYKVGLDRSSPSAFVELKAAMPYRPRILELREDPK